MIFEAGVPSRTKSLAMSIFLGPLLAITPAIGVPIAISADLALSVLGINTDLWNPNNAKL